MNKYQAAVLINLEFQTISKSIREIGALSYKMPSESEYKKYVDKIKLAELFTKIEKARQELRLISFNE